MTSQLTRAATWYARHGWPVFPLRPGTKEPFAQLGVYKATCDAAQVGQWWRRWPEANIGLHCGGVGVLAFDLDTYKDCYAGGRILSYEDQETVTSLTGGGGTHLLYGMPPGARFGNGTGSLPDGIDIRGWGGYIVLPPSVHPSGNLYRWELGYGPHEIPIRPMPAQLVDLLSRSGATRRQLEALPPDNEAVAIAADIVEAVLSNADLCHKGREEYSGGARWVLTECPFNPPTDPHPTDKAAFVVVLPDGRISAGCHHQRCRLALRNAQVSGWQWIKRLGEYRHA